jgi:2-polyprenyl-6-hydroxyphenyl methylase/3-demethylubiquinone-9 3-methyltransferase
VRGLLIDTLAHRHNPIHRFTRYKSLRGMSQWHDWIDWIGGYPFEVASPEQIFLFYRRRGFVLQQLKTCGGRMGNNEFVFQKWPTP